MRRSIELSSNEGTNYGAKTAKYIMQNVPALKDESYVNNVDNYSASVFHSLASTKFPNSMVELFATSWEDIAKKIYNSSDFGEELKKTNYFEEDLTAALAGITNKNEKMVAIFQFVKDRMNWNNYTGYSCNDGVKTAYKQKTGNTAEINLMLTAMLRNAGFQARPVLISTRANGIAVFPNQSAYNYVIVAVEDNNNIVLLDATDKYALPNQIPFRALNWFGRLIREDGSSTTIDLMPRMVSKENVAMNYSIDKAGAVKGAIRKQYSDYNAQVFRNNYVGLKEDQYLEKLENDLNKIEITDYVRTNADKVYQPVQETFSFTGGNFCDVVGDKIYIAPMLFLASSKNPFNQEKREYPVDFGFPFQDKYAINIEIPEGYKVESLPSVANLQTEQNICSFKYNIQVNGNKIQLVVIQDIHNSIVSPNDYKALQEAYKLMTEKQNEKIVLKKI